MQLVSEQHFLFEDSSVQLLFLRFRHSNAAFDHPSSSWLIHSRCNGRSCRRQSHCSSACSIQSAFRSFISTCARQSWGGICHDPWGLCSQQSPQAP